MDRRTVLTKTAKGLMEVTGKTSLLAREQRSLLSHIDGKATVGDLQNKVGKLSDSKLNQMLGRMIRDGFVREFVSAPNSLSPPSQLGTRHDLDFSEFIPQDKAHDAAMQAAEAAQIARAMHENRARVDKKSASAAAKTDERGAQEKVRYEATAKRIAEDKARAELVAKAKREAEERARQEAEAIARRELEEKARVAAAAEAKRAAEEKARRDAEAQAQREAEAQAKRQAEEEAKRAAEEKARQEAEAAARREAQATAKREAEEKARKDAQAKRVAEEKARKEAEADARREVQATAKRETEEKARKDAEVKAQRAAEDNARREAEAAAKRKEAEAHAQREADEKARRKAEAEAKTKRAAEEKSRREAEAKAKREADEKARQEAKARALAQAAEIAQMESETRAKRDAEQAEGARRGWQEREEQQRAELKKREAREETAREAGKEAKRRLLEQERKRARADAERTAHERREQRAREKAESDARASEQRRERDRDSATVVARLRRIRSGRAAGGAGKWLLGIVVTALVVGAAAVPFLQVDVARYEKQAASVLGVPVTIGDAAYALTPWPALEFRNIGIGAAHEAKIGKIIAVPSALSLWSDTIVLQRLDLSNVSVKPEAVAGMLSRKSGMEIPGLRDIALSHVTLDAPGITLPPLHGRIELGSATTDGKLLLKDSGGALSIEMTPRGGGNADFELRMSDMTALLGIPFSDVVAKGSLGADGAEVVAFDGRLYGGMLKGQGVLGWNPRLSFKGTLDATSVAVASVAPVLAEGRLGGGAQFSMQADAFDDLFVRPRLAGRFNVEKGVLQGFDLPRSLQAGIVSPGTTSFDELNGQFVLENGDLRLRAMHLKAGLMKASGTAEFIGGKNVDGRIAAELRIPAGMVRTNFGFGGTPQALTVKR